MKLPVDASSIPWIVEDPITKERTTLDIGGQEPQSTRTLEVYSGIP
ncbi:hypothetical protein [Dyadobacter linearis]|nr:hypothetical protein [Dyadobacter sp. CECT 9623]